jgi:hypothetical protein
VASAKSLDLASQLEISLYLGIIEDAEAVYDRERLSRSLHDMVRIEILKLFVAYREYHYIGLF